MDVPRQIKKKSMVLTVESYLHVQELSLTDAGESRGGLSEYGLLLLRTVQTDCGSIGSYHPGSRLFGLRFLFHELSLSGE